MQSDTHTADHNETAFAYSEELTRCAERKYQLQPADAQDVAIETMLTVEMRRSSIRGPVLHFAFGVLRRKIQAFHRKKKMDQLESLPRVDPETLNDACYVMIDAELDLAEMYRSLSSVESMTLDLLEFQESYKEMAKKLGCSIRTVGTRVRRLKRMINEYLYSDS